MSARFLLVLAFASLPLVSAPGQDATEQKGKKYALLVGVKEYQREGLGNLKHTEKDVERLDKVLREKCGFKTTVLTTGGKTKPTAKNIRAALAAITKKTTRHDTLLIALAGHGVQVGVVINKDGKEKDESFFCPYDAHPRTGQKMAALKETLIPMAEVFKDLEESGAGVKLILVDACRNDLTRDSTARALDLETVPRPASGIAALFACKSGELAFETSKLNGGQGVFFNYVIEGLEGKARRKGVGVTWSSLTDYVTENVSTYVKNEIGKGAKQTPHELKNLVGRSPLLVPDELSGDAAEAQKHFDAALKFEIARDYKKAYPEFRKAADLGHATGMNRVGVMLCNARGVDKDQLAAVKWFQKAYEAGEPYGAANLGYCYNFGVGVTRNDRKAVEWYRAAAAEGHAGGIASLGQMYELGLGVKQDYKEAVKLYDQAAGKGDESAMYFLAECYANGRGVSANASRAVTLYERAANKGMAVAMGRLGKAYEDGKGAEKNNDLAYKWYSEGAKGGNFESMNGLGNCLFFARGVKQDRKAAVEWYRKSAEGGWAAGMGNYGWMLERGHDVKQDRELAAKWYTKGADAGDAQSLCGLGNCYFFGYGLTKQPDMKRAFDYYKRAAEGGSDEAYGLLGYMYNTGLGATRNDVEAVKWYKKGAEARWPLALNNLGGAHYTGIGGLKKDPKEALACYRRAADGGDALGMYYVGWMHHHGEGTPKDLKAAADWYRKAAAAGNADAKTQLKALGEKE